MGKPWASHFCVVLDILTMGGTSGDSRSLATFWTGSVLPERSLYDS